MRRALVVPLMLLLVSCRSRAGGALVVSGTAEVTEVRVASVLAGRIASIAVDEGARVKKGEAVFTLDTADLDARRAVAQAALGQAESAIDVVAAQKKAAQEQADFAEREYKRAQELAKTNAISDRDRSAAENQVTLARAGLRTATQAYDQAVATRKAAQASLDAVGVSLGQATVVSPLDGIVLTRLREPGEVVTPGGAVLVIADVSKPWVRVFVPVTRMEEIHVGDRATVKTDSATENTFGARVRHIAEQAEFTPRDVQTPEERVKQVFEVKLDVEDPKGALKAGVPVDVVFGG